MSDRPQWMKDAANDINELTDLRPVLEIIAVRYAAEDARVQELRTAAEEASHHCECMDCKMRLRKALKAFELVSASSAGGEHV